MNNFEQIIKNLPRGLNGTVSDGKLIIYQGGKTILTVISFREGKYLYSDQSIMPDNTVQSVLLTIKQLQRKN